MKAGGTIRIVTVPEDEEVAVIYFGEGAAPVGESAATQN
jgi:hypothetical protein